MLQIRFHSLITSALILGLLSGAASAALYTWDGKANGGGNWSGSANGGNAGDRNWASNTAPIATGSDQFVFGGVANLSNTNNIGDFTLTSLTFNNTAGAFVLGGTFTLFFNAGAGIVNQDAELQTINMALGLNVTTTVATTSGNVALGGAISGAGGITKTGTNTLTLSSATNSYTGATSVNQGTLLVNGNIATSATTVASGATIGGSGTTGALTVNTGGFVNPGTTTGILSTGNYTQAGTYNTTITSTVAGTGYDQVNVTGSVNITGGSLSTSFSGSYSANNLIFILLNDGTDAITGTYNGLAQNAIVTTHGGFSWQISYTANSGTSSFTGGNDIALRAIPEPSAALLSGLGAVLLLFRRRRA